MDKFISIPIVVEAVQFNNVKDLLDLPEIDYHEESATNIWASFLTIHGERAIARPGDWVVQETQQGRYYPVKPDIFARKYKKYIPEKKWAD